MRNLKKFLAVLVVAVMIVSSLAVTSFAAADPSMTPADKAVGLGLLQGGSNGVDEEYLNTNTQRIQTAIIYLRLLGLEDKAKAYTATTDNFADADKVKDVPGAVNLLAYLKANPQLGWVGDGTNFNPTGDVSGKALYKVMLTSLGYTQGLDFDYDDTIGFARAKGFALAAFVGTSDSVSNNAMAAAMMEAVDLPMNGKTTTLAQNLVDTKVITADVAAKYTGYTVAPVGPLAITSIKSTNLIQLNVAFNAPIDATKGIDKANYTVKVDTKVKTIATDGISLSADKMTATILLDGNITDNWLSQSDKVTVTYAKAAAGTTADLTATSDAINDTAIPTVKSVTVTGNKLVKVTFSEPIKYSDAVNLANYKIDGNVLPSAAPALSTDGLVASLKLSSALAAGVHKVVVSGSDYAGMPLITNSTDITVATDTTAPAKVTLVGDATQSVVTVQFDKGIDGMDSAKVGSLVSKIEVDGTDATKVKLTFDPTISGSGFLPASPSTITFTNVKDLFGNVAASMTLAITPVLDNVRPTFVSMSQPSNLAAPVNQRFVVTFSKEVADPTGTAANGGGTYELKDKDGNIVSLTKVGYFQDDGATAVNKKEVSLLASAPIDDTTKGPWTLKITDVKDNTALGNLIVETTQTLTFADKTAPDPAGVTAALNGQYIYVAFPEKMDTTTVLAPASYTLTKVNGTTITALPSDCSLSLSADGKVVSIYFPSTTYNFAADAAFITVFGAKDVAGNVGASARCAVATNGLAPTIDAARLTDKHTVVVHLTGPDLNSNSVVPYDYKVTYVAAGATAPSVLTTNTATYDSTKDEVTLKINEEISPNATYSGSALRIYTADQTPLSTKTLAAVELTAIPLTGAVSPIVVSDDARPSLSSSVATTAYYDVNGNGTGVPAITIKVTVDEAMSVTNASFAAGELAININGTLRALGTISATNSNVLIIRLTGASVAAAAADINKTVTVTYTPNLVANARDMSQFQDATNFANNGNAANLGNILNAFTTTCVVSPNP